MTQHYNSRTPKSKKSKLLKTIFTSNQIIQLGGVLLIVTAEIKKNEILLVLYFYICQKFFAYSSGEVFR